MTKPCSMCWSMWTLNRCSDSACMGQPSTSQNSATPLVKETACFVVTARSPGRGAIRAPCRRTRPT